jgi:hypothetical protein
MRGKRGRLTVAFALQKMGHLFRIYFLILLRCRWLGQSVGAVGGAKRIQSKG